MTRSSDDDHPVNITDEEKEKLRTNLTQSQDSNRPFLDTVLSALDCTENDYSALLSLCLIYALATNKGKFFFVFFFFVSHSLYIQLLCRLTPSYILHNTYPLECYLSHNIIIG